MSKIIDLPRETRAILYCLRRLFSLTEPEPAPDSVSEEEFAKRFDKGTVVWRMVVENAPGKAALARLYTKFAFSKEELERRNKKENQNPNTDPIFGAPPPDPLRPESVSVHWTFIESGSTLLYLSSELAKQPAWTRAASLYEHDPAHLPTALFATATNNNLAAHIFLSGADDKDHRVIPYLLPGFLEPKYEGIFAFYQERNKPAKQYLDKLIKIQQAAERRGYAQTRAALADCHLLLLAASRLSLIFGPLVGSRENAIFKNACYNACVPPLDGPGARSHARRISKEIHLFITLDKLVAHDPKNIETPTFKDELANIRNHECFPVFDMDLGDGDRIKSEFTTLSERSQPLYDGTRAPWLGDGFFRVCDTWPELFNKAFLEVSVFIAYSKSSPERKRLEREVAFAQGEKGPRKVRFELSPAPVAEDDNYALALLRITGRSDGA